MHPACEASLACPVAAVAVAADIAVYGIFLYLKVNYY